MGIENGDCDSGISRQTPFQLFQRNGLEGGKYFLKL